MSTEARVRDQARLLGFEACGFSSAAPPGTAKQFSEWLAQGRHGTMDYLARTAHKRADPQLVLPNAKTIVMLVCSYWMDLQAGSSRSPCDSIAPSKRGVVARYAQFSDYHDLLADRLRTMAQFLDACGGAGTRSLWYIDTGPLLERDFAQRAGLGFVGKHTNLINRRMGNWILLAAVITTLSLEPDTPEPNRCGTCTRCLEACPTQAIVAPFQLDARLCISYLTIEHKGPIPKEMRPLIGNRVFGCDDCLAACPWNRFAVQGQLMTAHSRHELAAPDLIPLLTIGDEEFRRRFVGTPLERTKRRGLVRNACVALGNVGDSSTLPALRRAAQESDPLVSEHAHWAIEQIQQRQG